MKISKKLVIEEANEVKKFFDKNKKLPKYATINNSQFTPPQYCYIFAKLISKMSLSTVNKMIVAEPKNSIVDNVNFTLSENEYVSLAQRVASFIESNKRCPSYANYKNKQIGYELYLFCFVKILSFYKEKGRLPSTCTFNSAEIKYTKKTTQTTKKTTATPTSSNTKKTKKDNCENPYVSAPHLTSSSNGLGQDYKYSCACNSMQQAFYKLTGKKISEKILCSWAGTTTKGTSENGIRTAVAKFNKEYKTNLKVTFKYFSDLGKTETERYTALGKLLCQKNKAVITHIGYQDSGEKINDKATFGHWEVLDRIDVKSKTVRALNSLGYRSGNGYKGHLQVRSWKVQSHYFAKTTGGQKAILIISKE